MSEIKLWIGAALAALSLGLAVPAGPAAAQDTAQNNQNNQDKGYALGDMVLGEEDAPVTIVEYASYTCPHCAHFHNETFPALKKQYIEAGKVRFVFREFIRNRVDLAAAVLARCAGPERFHGVVNMLFRQQANWLGKQDKLTALRQIARFGGLSEERMDMCLADEELANGILKVTQTAMQEHNIDGTPTFLINGDKFSGSLSLDNLEKVLAEYLP